MSELAPLVAAALRDKVVEELQEEVRKLREEKAQLAELALDLSQMGGLVTIRSNGNNGQIYAYGAKDPSFQYDDVLSWPDDVAEVEIEMRRPPALIAQCPVQEVANAEIHLGGRILKLRDCSGNFSWIREGYVNYGYLFGLEEFAPHVDVFVTVKFGPVLDWESRGLSNDMEDRSFHLNPSRFQNQDIANVLFEDDVVFVANFHHSSDEEDMDEEE